MILEFSLNAFYAISIIFLLEKNRAIKAEINMLKGRESITKKDLMMLLKKEDLVSHEFRNVDLEKLPSGSIE